MISLIILVPLAWITTHQAEYGVTLDTIKAQFSGNPTSHPQTQLGSLWSMPKSNPNPPGTQAYYDHETYSLGGGITWAWDPALCEPLISRFSEKSEFSSFVSCNDAKAAVSRAFDQWAASNRWLNFKDVTHECEKLGMLNSSTGAPWLYSAPGADRPFHGGCPLAEVWVTALPEYGGTTGGDIAVATWQGYEERSRRYNNAFVSTNGYMPHKRSGNNIEYADMMITYGGKLSFATSGQVGGVNLCWYLDSKFCYGFHQYKKQFSSPADAKQMVAFLCWSISALALTQLILHRFGLYSWCYRERTKRDSDRDGDGVLTLSEGGLAILEEISTWNPLFFALSITLIIAPPCLYHSIFLPCWDCADFEGAALHEIGHLVGLGHPDRIPDNIHPQAYTLYPALGSAPTPNTTYVTTDLTLRGRAHAGNCNALWETTADGFPGSATDLERGVNGYLVRKSVMLAFTQHNPRACLAEDDVEGLSVLYPDCSSLSLSEPVCYSVRHNIGVVRIVWYLFLPLAISMVVILLVASVAHEYLNNELEEARASLTTAPQRKTIGQKVRAATAGAAKRAVAKKRFTASVVEAKRQTPHRVTGTNFTVASCSTRA